MARQFELVKSEDLPVTQALAKRFAEMEGAPVERERSQGRINYIEARVKQGLDVPFHWAFVRLDGKEVRVNGRHSSEVVAGMNGNMPEGMIAHVEEYAVAGSAGMVALFRQFDPPKSARRPRDVCGAFLGYIEPLKGIPLGHAKLAIEGIAWYLRVVDPPEGIDVPTGDDRYAMLNDETYHPFIQWAGTLLSPLKTREMMRPPILAAMYATYETDSEPARDFWGDTARGGKEFDDKHPSTVLDGWLKAIHTNCPDGVKAGQIYQGCVFAWNAFRAGKPLDKLKFDTRKGFFEAE
jgi:hypothetical protein